MSLRKGQRIHVLLFVTDRGLGRANNIIVYNYTCKTTHCPFVLHCAITAVVDVFIYIFRTGGSFPTLNKKSSIP